MVHWATLFLVKATFNKQFVNGVCCYTACLFALVPILFKHYENMPMQYTEIFCALKIENFQLKNFDIFLIFAQNIDCGYTLEPP